MCDITSYKQQSFFAVGKPHSEATRHYFLKTEMEEEQKNEKPKNDMEDDIPLSSMKKYWLDENRSSSSPLNLTEIRPKGNKLKEIKLKHENSFKDGLNHKLQIILNNLDISQNHSNIFHKKQVDLCKQAVIKVSEKESKLSTNPCQANNLSNDLEVKQTPTTNKFFKSGKTWFSPANLKAPYKSCDRKEKVIRKKLYWQTLFQGIGYSVPEKNVELNKTADDLFSVEHLSENENYPLHEKEYEKTEIEGKKSQGHQIKNVNSSHTMSSNMKLNKKCEKTVSNIIITKVLGSEMTSSERKQINLRTRPKKRTHCITKSPVKKIRKLDEQTSVCKVNIQNCLHNLNASESVCDTKIAADACQQQTSNYMDYNNTSHILRNNVQLTSKDMSNYLCKSSLTTQLSINLELRDDSRKANVVPALSDCRADSRSVNDTHNLCKKAILNSKAGFRNVICEEKGGTQLNLKEWDINSPHLQPTVVIKRLTNDIINHWSHKKKFLKQTSNSGTDNSFSENTLENTSNDSNVFRLSRATSTSDQHCEASRHITLLDRRGSDIPRCKQNLFPLKAYESNSHIVSTTGTALNKDNRCLDLFKDCSVNNAKPNTQAPGKTSEIVTQSGTIIKESFIGKHNKHESHNRKVLHKNFSTFQPIVYLEKLSSEAIRSYLSGSHKKLVSQSSPSAAREEAVHHNKLSDCRMAINLSKDAKNANSIFKIGSSNVHADNNYVVSVTNNKRQGLPNFTEKTDFVAKTQQKVFQCEKNDYLALNTNGIGDQLYPEINTGKFIGTRLSMKNHVNSSETKLHVLSENPNILSDYANLKYDQIDRSSEKTYNSKNLNTPKVISRLSDIESIISQLNDCDLPRTRIENGEPGEKKVSTQDEDTRTPVYVTEKRECCGDDMSIVVPPQDIGLENPVSTNRCWMNVVLQTLFSMDIFMQNMAKAFNIREEEEGRLIPCLLKLYRARSYGHQDCVYEKVRKLIEILGTLNYDYVSNAQQDPSEFFFWLFSAIETSSENCSAASVINENFRFEMEERAHCISCQKVDIKSSSFLILMLDIRVGTSEVSTIEEALREYTSMKTVKRICSGCGKDDSSVQTLFKSSPRYLIINLKRYSVQDGEVIREETAVKYPTKLSLGIYSAVSSNFKNSESKSSIRDTDNPAANTRRKFLNGSIGDYDLLSVIHHSGDSVSSGHYVCDVYRHETRKWHYYNDKIVKEISTMKLLNKRRQKTAYIYVYIKHCELAS